MQTIKCQSDRNINTYSDCTSTQLINNIANWQPWQPLQNPALRSGANERMTSTRYVANIVNKHKSLDNKTYNILFFFLNKLSVHDTLTLLSDLDCLANPPG